MTDKHTQGRMKVGNSMEQNYIYVGDWHLGCISSADDCNGNDKFDDDSEAVSNARRITASWNALSGISTQAIEAGAVQGLVSAAGAVIKFCDENKTGGALYCVEQLRTALAAMGVKP